MVGEQEFQWPRSNGQMCGDQKWNLMDRLSLRKVWIALYIHMRDSLFFLFPVLIGLTWQMSSVILVVVSSVRMRFAMLTNRFWAFLLAAGCAWAVAILLPQPNVT